MPTSFGELLKVLGKLGGVAVTMALLMFTYMHMRGYSDNASWEISLVSLGIASISNLFPSPLKGTNETPPPTP